MERPDPPPKAPPSSLGYAFVMIVLGLVVFLPSGLCTGTMFISAISGSDSNLAFVPLIIGGPFVIGGGTLLWQGIKAIREHSQSRDEQ
jgi:hypothetical protein